MAVVVSDTSPVRALEHVGLLELLPDMFGPVVVPPAVADELEHPMGSGHAVNVRGRVGFEVVAARDSAQVDQLLRVLDRGEAEAIVVAEELHAELLLIDERAGQKVAHARGLATLGVLGLLVRAKKEGRVEAVRPYLDRLQNELDFWISASLREAVLNSVGEQA